MKKFWTISAILVATLIYACGGNNNTAPKDSEGSTTTQPDAAQTDNNTITDDQRGIGKFKDVELNNPLDANMVANGEKIYDMKCASCHKLTDEKLVGPGWKDVTKRRTPEWIMNFSTNTDEMLNKDATAMSMLEICLVRMPNQNLADEQARALLEFMRKNDGEI